MIDKRAVEPVWDSSPGFYSILFVVPKASGGWRPVIDLSALNRFLAIPTFSMETPEQIRLSMPKSAWVVSIDLKDAYFHVPMRRSIRKYLRFSFRGRVWQFRALPFGLSTAPWIFTMCVRELQSLALRQGISLYQYLDDWLIRHQCPQALLRQAQWVIDLASRMGFIINPRKSALYPQQEFVFLGYQFQTISASVCPTEARISKLFAVLDSFLEGPPQPASQWQSLLGLLAATEKLVPLGRLHMRRIQFHLKSCWSQALDNPNRPIPLSQLVREDLIWWRTPANVTPGLPFRLPPPSRHLFTDASLDGWGAHLDSMEVSARWNQSMRSCHINVLEMEAVFRALKHWEHYVLSQVILLATDNSTVVSYVNRQGGTHSRSLCDLTILLLKWCSARGISLQARHIPGHMNVLADRLSRRGQIQPSEWSLAPRVFELLVRLWGRPQVDLFATKWNARLPLYVSPIPDPAAWSVDALTTSWEGVFAYAFPPAILVPKVLSKIRSHCCRVLLITSFRPQKPWFPDLLALLMDFPRPLPDHWDLLKQPKSDVFHQAPQSLHLHAWALSSDAQERRAFLERCPHGSPEQIEDLHWQSMSPSGGSSVLGAVAGRLVLSKPLPL